MIQASCHCGAVVLDIAEPPTEITDCNCSICRRYGVLWAYYPPQQVNVQAPNGTDVYIWHTRTTAFHRCRTCGCVTHWSATDPSRNWMGVNARLMSPEIMAQARLRHLDGAVTDEYLD
jgi:hypothetical protein